MEKETWRKWSDDEEEDKALANGFTGKGVTHQATEECIGPKVKKLKKNYEDIAMNETVRKKSERKQLEAFDCLECQAYYGSLNMSEQERQERVKTCSRHRGTTARPSTPEGFWDTAMPTTPEAIKKGLIKISSQSQLSKSLDVTTSAIVSSSVRRLIESSFVQMLHKCEDSWSMVMQERN